MAMFRRGEGLLYNKDGKPSEINNYLTCRDGIVRRVKYHDTSGYGLLTEFYICTNSKHESKAIVRRVYIDSEKHWVEESMHFDSDSWDIVWNLLLGTGSKYHPIEEYRSFMEE